MSEFTKKAARELEEGTLAGIEELKRIIKEGSNSEKTWAAKTLAELCLKYRHVEKKEDAQEKLEERLSKKFV